MDRTEKQELVAKLRKLFEDSEGIVVAHYSGMTVTQLEALRKRARESGAGFKVAKNRLVRLALEGTDFQGLQDLFKGPTAIAYSKDPVAPAKVVVEFAKTNDKLVVVGGGMGKQVLDVNNVKALASLPSLDELRGKLVGLLVAPATKIAGVVQAPAGQLARVVKAYADKGAA